jgi:hypothetical protein
LLRIGELRLPWQGRQDSVYFRFMIRIEFSKFIAFEALLVATIPVFAQSPGSPQGAPGAAASAQAAPSPAPKPEETEVREPVPKVVTPGTNCGEPPSDAIVLFDGKNLDEWISNRDKSPAIR